jgi:hypothetical protein
MPQPRPLPRSLVPLPGESLPGFILRLSCRLSQLPARIAELTGLTPDGASGTHIPVILLAGIPETDSSTFTRMTRLTGAQAAQLSMSTWQERYPPVIASPESKARGARRLDGRLILAPATRYCPECLAGDGSAIQESFGGPWLKAWHLPVVFACPVHQRLLEHRCPESGHTVHARPGGRAPSALLPMIWAAGLHPAQCRADVAPGRSSQSLPVCCGARLDHAGPRRQASPELLALQGKILRLLDPDGPASTVSAGMPARPGSYFADLRALGLLAWSTWPAARHLSPCKETSAAIDQHAAALRQQEAERQANSPASPARTAPPPLDAAVSAGLAHIADRILAGTPDEARWQIRPLLPPGTREAGRTNWARWVTESATPCSEGLQTAYEPLLRKFTRTPAQPQGRRTALTRTHRWGPENVPALIPEDWYARHFTPLAGVSPALARRTAALRLIQAITGGSLGEAAEFLGISSGYGPWRRSGGRIYSPAGLARSGARQQPDPPGFETGLASLTRELSNPGTPLVNYQRRRQALETWSISEDTWPDMAAKRSLMSHPDIEDHTRQIASVYVWARVTSGEPRFAPRPIQATQPPEVQQDWRRRWSEIWGHLLHSSQPRSYYTRLRAELDALADSLAMAIDTRHAAHPPETP